MKLINFISKTGIIASIVIILYGYFCRAGNVFFFWESIFIGWMFLFVFITAWLFSKFKNRLPKRNKVILIAAGIALTLPTFWMLLILIIFPKTNAYKNSVNWLKKDGILSEELGEINKVSLVPFGSIEWTTSKGNETSAELRFILKGSKKYKDVKVLAKKNYDEQWTINLLQ